MILYHITPAKCVDKILAEGIKPANKLIDKQTGRNQGLTTGYFPPWCKVFLTNDVPYIAAAQGGADWVIDNRFGSRYKRSGS